jgi:hypothetical protein
MPQIETNSVTDRIARIQSGLREAARRKLAPFGSSDRDFHLEPPTVEAEVSDFERVCGVTLPSEYRTFITTLGDGGAGPGYGLLSLTRGLEYDVEPVTPELLRRPFEFTEFTDALHLLDRETDEYAPRPGSITISDAGCYLRHFIVVTGPTRGQMWVDHTTSDSGYWPLGVDFLTWYERWLDGVLAGGNGIWWSGFVPRGHPAGARPPGPRLRHNQTLQRTGAAGIFSNMLKWFGRSPGQ